VARLLRLPDGDRFVPLEQTLVAFIDELFPGMDVGEPCIFRVTRDADLALDDDAADDLLLALQEELRRRRFLPVVRLEIDSRTSEAPVERLTEELGLGPDDVYHFAGPLGLECLWTIHALDRPELHDEPWTPLIPPALTTVEREEGATIFSVLDRQDVLVHHPYDSFSASVQELMNEAADDPHVLAIKQCLYRTSGDSPVVAALVRAAEHGKQVAALVEVTARFDEEANIGWARALEEAGAHVIYGLMGLKTHAKTTLVVRQEGDAVRLYCHVGTGNYNPKTARIYEDLGVLSSRAALGGDVTRFFNYITGFSQPPHYQELVTSPGGIRDRVVDCIDEQAVAGPAGRIVIKVNGLDDVAVIDALYRASQAGVPIDLIIRGICCLRPGVPGLSENIRVRSIVGRFLEHSRILRFGGGASGPASYYIGSADLRRRNLDRRVEAMIPVADPDAVVQLEEILQLNLADDAQSWELDPDGMWHRIPTTVGVSAQKALQAAALERSLQLDDALRPPPAR
jgi:polyphosphate kinase